MLLHLPPPPIAYFSKTAAADLLVSLGQLLLLLPPTTSATASKVCIAAGWLAGADWLRTDRHTMASYVRSAPLDLYIYVTHVYFWGNFNRLFRYWVCTDEWMDRSSSKAALGLSISQEVVLVRTIAFEGSS